jgi:hypothetical protein
MPVPVTDQKIGTVREALIGGTEIEEPVRVDAWTCRGPKAIGERGDEAGAREDAVKPRAAMAAMATTLPRARRTDRPAVPVVLSLFFIR